jgi:hypothetical protein
VVLVTSMMGPGSAQPNLRALRLDIWRGMAAVLAIAALAGRGTSWTGIEVHVPTQERPIYRAIAQLPRDALIAGWPAGPMENIPYLSARRVLTDFQLEMPFHTRFTLDTRRRLDALFEAYFATGPRPIQRLCSEFHVTHLLVDPRHFAQPRPDYYEPYGRKLAQLFRAAEPCPWLLQGNSATNATTRFATGQSLIELALVPELAPACSRQEPR